MSKQVWKGSALVAPVPPALVSCGTLEAPNVLTVAWTGMLQSQPPKTYISVRPERYSHGLITESREFVINLPTAALVRAIDYCGVRSGRDESKFEAMHLTALAASVTAVNHAVNLFQPVFCSSLHTEIIKKCQRVKALAAVLKKRCRRDGQQRRAAR